MMSAGDLVGGECPAGNRETALDRHVDHGVCRPARRWGAHFNIHERSARRKGVSLAACLHPHSYSPTGDS